MPIKIKDNLPAIEILNRENIFVMTESRAYHQDIRTLKIAVVDLTPSETIYEVLRSISNSPLQVEVTIICPTTIERNRLLDPLRRFYKTFEAVQAETFDGLIITGVSNEALAFEDIPFMDELNTIMNWSINNSFSTLHVGWGAQLALYHHYGLKSYSLEEKLLGVFTHHVCKHNTKLLKGFDDVFNVPHARSADISKEDVIGHKMLTILSESSDAGLYILEAETKHQIFVTGNIEFNPQTLKEIYDQAVIAGEKINTSKSLSPKNTWKSHSTLLMNNWLNYYVYQETPYDLSELMYFI